MYQSQAFSSSTYVEMLSGSPVLPHKGTGGPACNSFTEDYHVPRTQLGLVDEQNIQCQSLSLSLETFMPSVSVPQLQYQHPGAGFLSLMANSLPNGKGTVSFKDDEISLHKELPSAECLESVTSGGFNNTMPKDSLYNLHSSVFLKDAHSDPCMPGSSGFLNAVLNSQYLKTAQELLDEIVSVRKALKQPGLENFIGKSTSQSKQISSEPNGSTTNSSCELSPAERLELLDKKTKLLSMLDEIDQRYRKYCHQMQAVVSSFDMMVGCGAAEPYTTLALRTISRHFRQLRDAISSQIQVTERRLGEQEGIPRLRYIDQQLRQQKTLEQLGVIQQAWRPQKGLPENSVSILRAWLLEHFLHPYPKDSEKIMLARQTGLTRNQVANWFINARVRLWKPMVEEMYKEEFGGSEMSCNLSSENTPKASRDGVQVSDNKWEEFKGKSVTDEVSNHSSTAELDKGIQCSASAENSFYSSNHNSNGCVMGSTRATYDLSELGSFPVGGYVSLALELRNCESIELAMSDDGIHKRRNQEQRRVCNSHLFIT